MDWWKWLVGTAGVILLGALGSALWDAAKTGGRLARDWQTQQAARARQVNQTNAAALAGDTQRLIIWVGSFVLMALAFVGMAVVASGIAFFTLGNYKGVPTDRLALTMVLLCLPGLACGYFCFLGIRGLDEARKTLRTWELEEHEEGGEEEADED